MSCVKNQPMEHPSLPVRGAWIEISVSQSSYSMLCASLPVRGAWIEILGILIRLFRRGVAPRAGSVD